jgi:glutamate-5-semialdehyde dehydrogenase
MTTDTAALLEQARSSARTLARTSHAGRQEALQGIWEALGEEKAAILSANAEDAAAASQAGISEALLDRLILNESRFEGMLRALREVISLPDPLAEMRKMGTRPNGLEVFRRRVPLGVLAIVYEARPNVTIEAASLALKSGNAIVLRGGREASRSNAALVRAAQNGLQRAGLPRECIQRVEDDSRERVKELLQAVGYVDLVVPRGGPELMKMVDDLARVPVIRHGQGITHLFVDRSADAQMAEEIVFNSKVQRPGVCNALETLLLHEEWTASDAWPRLALRLSRDGKAELRVDSKSAASLGAQGIPFRSASESDYRTEFLSLVLAVRTVPSLDQALAHIAEYGTRHTAGIVTQDERNAERFLQEVDASCVLWNASTRFNDGGELGLGAEMGISTSKLHAYGPMGLRELTTEKFVVYGAGQVRG